MDYGTILANAWTIILRKRFLFALSILSLLGAYAGLGGLSYIVNPSQLTHSLELFGYGTGSSVGPHFSNPDGLEGFRRATVIFGINSLMLGTVFWFNSRISAGGLIAGADKIGNVTVTSFRHAWMTGWERRQQMWGLGLITLIPAWIFGVPIYLLHLTIQEQQWEIVDTLDSFYAYLFTFSPNSTYKLLGLWSLVLVGMVVYMPFHLILLLAERSCILGNSTLSRSVQSACQIAGQNVGEIVVVFVVQIGIGIGIGLVGAALCSVLYACHVVLVLFLPFGAALLPLIVAPFVLLVLGIIQTYFSVVWTLAWRKWTPVISPTISVSE